MDEVFSSQPDLTDQPIGHLDIEYFTDGSSFVQDGTYCARCAVVTLVSVTEAHLLPAGTSAQKAELVALTQALQLTAEVWKNLYTDSKYAFTTIYVPRALYKERGLINSGGRRIKYGQEILKLLDAVWVPKWMTVIHCTKREMQQLSAKADREAKKAALIRGPVPTVLMVALFLSPLANWDPLFIPQEQVWFKTEEKNFLPDK
jgi:ribonuclease HI